MQVLIAPNAFKHGLDAEQVANAIRKGFMQSRLKCTCTCFPIGDGGDGTGKLIIKRCGGKKLITEVHDPLGKKIHAHFGLIDKGRTAVIEMAEASGLRLLKKEKLNPLRARSFGTGEQIRQALDKGVKRIIIGIGGSATVDGATGILQALGIRFLDIKGLELDGLPASLHRLASIDLSGLDKRMKQTELIVLCDVDNPLLGENGAAAVFGPQKGASVKDVHALDKALQTLSAVALKHTGKNMATVKRGGAAGGVAAGLYAFLNAKLVNGIDYFLGLTGFDKALSNADLVITGEGSIDEQTLRGKGPVGVARRAKQQHLPVIGIAGKIPLQQSSPLQKYFDVLVSINHQPLELQEALAATDKNLIRTARQIGNLLSIHLNIER